MSDGARLASTRRLDRRAGSGRCGCRDRRRARAPHARARRRDERARRVQARSRRATTTPQTGEPAFPAPPEGRRRVQPYGRQRGRRARGRSRKAPPAPGIGARRPGQGRRGTRRLLRRRRQDAARRPCGPGCYRAKAPPSKVPEAIDVRVSGKKPVTWRVPLPKPWPPRDASAIVARATKTFRRLEDADDRRLALVRVSARTLHTHWVVAAPNRLTYQVRGGPSAVIIGNTRWDKVAPGEPWVKSAQTPIHQPTQFWVSWQNAHVIEEHAEGLAHHVLRPEDAGLVRDPTSPRTRGGRSTCGCRPPRISCARPTGTSTPRCTLRRLARRAPPYGGAARRVRLRG